MINRNELRPGIALMHKKEGVKTVQWLCLDDLNNENLILCDDNSSYNIDEFEPIPLTPELLGQYGFEKTSDRSYKLKNFGQFIFLPPWGMTFKPAGMLDSLLRQDLLRYLHQLQNLYFALTGKELPLKKPLSV